MHTRLLSEQAARVQEKHVRTPKTYDVCVCHEVCGVCDLKLRFSTFFFVLLLYDFRNKKYYGTSGK